MRGRGHRVAKRESLRFGWMHEMSCRVCSRAVRSSSRRRNACSMVGWSGGSACLANSGSIPPLGAGSDVWTGLALARSATLESWPFVDSMRTVSGAGLTMPLFVQESPDRPLEKPSIGREADLVPQTGGAGQEELHRSRTVGRFGPHSDGSVKIDRHGAV
jgi:hypothetical protein